MENSRITFLDCTLRDGGYYNQWDFDRDMINDYLNAISEVGVKYVELGFRSLINKGFKGSCAFTTDDFIRSLILPENIDVGVMINANEIIHEEKLSISNLEKLFPEDTTTSKVKLVRVACHIYEFEIALEAVNFLKSKGFNVGLNLMQISEQSEEKIKSISINANNYDIDVLYFADSLGNLNSENIFNIVNTIKLYWSGEIGIHAHDNLGLALSNTLSAIENEVTWVDSTVSGMGRGAGNTKTELLSIEIAKLNKFNCNLVPLMQIIEKYFDPLLKKYKWGCSIYYYLSAKYSIHPTYIQEMLNNPSFKNDDIFATIENLSSKESSKFSLIRLNSASQFYSETPLGKWSPKSVLNEKKVLIIGSGPSIQKYQFEIESFIKKNDITVIAINSQSIIDNKLIDYRISCHPFRILSDIKTLNNLKHPLITPFSMLPSKIKSTLKGLKILDYGLAISGDCHSYLDKYCLLPNSLVISYALAVVTSGNSSKVLIAGFDGYTLDDPRRIDVENIFSIHNKISPSTKITSITPTNYNLDVVSLYSL